MSDPMTKVEIEDVLSSIRRLVSEDRHVPQANARRPDAPAPRPMLSAAPAPEALASAGGDALDRDFDAPRPEPDHAGADLAAEGTISDPEAQAPAQPDPLVLTPQLRVADAESASLRASLEETIAELEAAVSGAGGEWEPDGSEMPLDSADFGGLAASLAAPVASEDLTEEVEGLVAEVESDLTVGVELVDLAEEAQADDLAYDLAAEAAGPAPDMEHGAGDVAGDAQGAPEADVEDAAVPDAVDLMGAVEQGEGPVRLVSDTGDARPEGLWSQYPETMEWAAPGDVVAETAAEEGTAEREAGGDFPLETLGTEAADAEGLDLGSEESEATEAADIEAAAPETDADLADRFWAAEAEDEALAVDPALPEAELSGAFAPDRQEDAEDGRPRRLHLAGGLDWGATPPISAAGRGWQRAEPEDSDLLEAEEDEDGLFDEVEDAVLDEAALRALVSEIIRQELQGTLGERITRSVRKLVRREIQRALASRDFE